MKSIGIAVHHMNCESSLWNYFMWFSVFYIHCPPVVAFLMSQQSPGPFKNPPFQVAFAVSWPWSFGRWSNTPSKWPARAAWSLWNGAPTQRPAPKDGSVEGWFDGNHWGTTSFFPALTLNPTTLLWFWTSGTFSLAFCRFSWWPTMSFSSLANAYDFFGDFVQMPLKNLKKTI